MEWASSLSRDSAERRRLQNREAQRKFRERRSMRRATEKAQSDHTATSYSSATPPPAVTHSPSSLWPWPGAGPGPQLTTTANVTPHPSATTSNHHHQQLITSELHDSDTLNTDVRVPDDADFWNLNADENFIAYLGTSSSDNSIPPANSTNAELISPSIAQASSISLVRSNSRPDSGLARSHVPSNEEALRPNPRHLQGLEHSFDITPRIEHNTSSSGSRSGAALGNDRLSTMHIAAQKGHDNIVRILLRRGMSFNERDSDGRTPLILAVIASHVAVVRALLAHGARIDDVDHEGRSALHWAVLQRQEAVLSLLLDHSDGGRNLNIDAYDDIGWTPLHLAVERGFEAGMLLLLQYGANLHFRARRCPKSGNIIPPDHNR